MDYFSDKKHKLFFRRAGTLKRIQTGQGEVKQKH